MAEAVFSHTSWLLSTSAPSIFCLSCWSPWDSPVFWAFPWDKQQRKRTKTYTRKKQTANACFELWDAAAVTKEPKNEKFISWEEVVEKYPEFRGNLEPKSIKKFEKRKSISKTKR